MEPTNRLGQSDEYRREELIRAIEHSIAQLTLPELEALYYDMSTKNYINDRRDYL
ncbi:MAG: hypothetical protein II854_03420 [Prevotella sp.]|jgi:hypothetical protein|nr:hypothetical protein [Prevotella sp.]